MKMHWRYFLILYLYVTAETQSLRSISVSFLFLALPRSQFALHKYALFNRSYSCTLHMYYPPIVVCTYTTSNVAKWQDSPTSITFNHSRETCPDDGTGHVIYCKWYLQENIHFPLNAVGLVNEQSRLPSPTLHTDSWCLSFFSIFELFDFACIFCVAIN